MLVDLLIVEDDLTTLVALDALFRRQGWSVRRAMTLAGARAMIAVDRPRAVVLDVMLPDGSGLDLLREIRRAGHPIRVVVTTGTGDGRCGEAREAGADLVLTKPVDLVALIGSVRGEG